MCIFMKTSTAFTGKLPTELFFQKNHHAVSLLAAILSPGLRIGQTGRTHIVTKAKYESLSELLFQRNKDWMKNTIQTELVQISKDIIRYTELQDSGAISRKSHLWGFFLLPLTCSLSLQNSLTYLLRVLQQSFAGLDNLKGNNHTVNISLLFSTSAKLVSHNKAGSRLLLVAAYFHKGRAQKKTTKKKQVVITDMLVWVVAELPSLKPKLEGRRHIQLGCL